MSDFLKLEIILSASCADIYNSWLEGSSHSKLIGGASADIKEEIGSTFTIYDGYITGKILELEKNKRIVQLWRTNEFAENSPDSKLEILLEDNPGGGTKFTLLHWELPEGDKEKYKKGWEDFYLVPMKKYFEEIANSKKSNSAIISSEKPVKSVAKKKQSSKKKPISKKKTTAKKKVSVKKKITSKKKETAKKKIVSKKKSTSKKKPASKKKSKKR